MKKKILVTGGTGRFGSILKGLKTNYEMFFPSKTTLDITNFRSIQKYIKLKKPNFVIHLAGLSRPMNIHEKNISESIDKNIIGTCNLVKICSKYNIKIIYFSTSYVYPGKTGNYSENNPLLPYNNYSWSKLGGECAVQMYNNSLILRLSMTEKPFIHKYAFTDLITNFIFHEKIINMIPKLIKFKGIINVGGKTSSVYNFVKKYNKSVKRVKTSIYVKKKIPLNHSMNLKKLYKILNKK